MTQSRSDSLNRMICVGFVLLLLFLGGCGPKQRFVVRETRAPAEKRTVEKRESLDEKGPLRIPVPEKEIEKLETQFVQYGIASWYGPDFHGKPTSSGEVYDMYQLTCAHNSLPLGTTVIVTNLETGRSVELKVNDRGPFVKERIIDVSYSAARILGMWEKGTAPVRVEGVGPVTEQIFVFTVQVASFTEEARARGLAEQLRKDFRDVQVTTVETSTQKYHRVRIGQFDTKEPALAMAEQLSQLGYKVLITNR